MAAQIAANAPPGWLEPQARPARRCSCRSPSHPGRARRRGFNQARAIAGALASRAGLSVADCLVAAGRGGTQVGRHRAERRSGPAGSVDPARAARRPARSLVDDVVTTGATLSRLRGRPARMPAREVRAVAFARTLGSWGIIEHPRVQEVRCASS